MSQAHGYTAQSQQMQGVDQGEGNQYARLDPTELALSDMLVGPQVPLGFRP